MPKLTITGLHSFAPACHVSLRVDGTESKAICVVAPLREEVVFGEGTSWHDDADDGPLWPSIDWTFDETLA